MNGPTIHDFNRAIFKVTGSPADNVTDDEWKARCPAHDDTATSLSIRFGDGGETAIACAEGCSCDAICDSLGFAKSKVHAIRSTDFAASSSGPETSEAAEVPSRPGQSSDDYDSPEAALDSYLAGEPLSKHVYCDANGDAVGMTAMFESNGQRVIRAVGKVGSSWQKRAPKGPRPHYRLEDLTKANHVVICIDEPSAKRRQPQLAKADRSRRPTGLHWLASVL